MNDHAGVWDPIEDFPIAKLLMEENFHCQDGTYCKSISASTYPGSTTLSLAGTPTTGAIATPIIIERRLIAGRRNVSSSI